MHPNVTTWPRRMVARTWLLAFVPVNAATAGFGVLLPLLILLRLHGSLLDVAFAAVLFNGAVILASVLWGYLCDRYPDRRTFLVVNFAGFAVVYAVLGLAPSLPLLDGLYLLVGLLVPAGTSASNLLILEEFPEAERPAAYASFQEMSIVGGVGGVLVGYLWLLGHGALTPLLFVFAALAAASVVAVLLGVRPSGRAIPSSHVVRHADSLLSRIRHHVGLRSSVPFFPHRPRLDRAAWARFRRWVAEECHHELPLILLAGFLFNLAANLFNTSYVPYLRAAGLASSSIFLVNLANNSAQGLSFPASGTLAGREGSGLLVRQATYLRALGYLAVAGFTFAPMAIGLAFGANLAVYAVLGAAIALYSTASGLLLFRGLAQRDAGTIIGVNSALGGLAAVLGALLSGLLSYYGSYRLTFLVAAGALLVSLPLWAAVELADAKRRGAAVARIEPAPVARPLPPAVPAPQAPAP